MEQNHGQETVINTVEGQMIVIACPGSGKTTTLVRRIHHMVADCLIPSEQILMVTFSNAAAKEMKERYQKMYGVDQVSFSTIHGLCLGVLRKFAGYDNSDILTNNREFFFNKLRYNKQINDKDEFINSLITEISVIKNNSIPMEEYQPKCCSDKTLFCNLLDEYEEYKQETHLIDFDDMMILAYQEMLNNQECLTWLRNHYRYIQVDEYQDTNYLQRDILYLLAGENGNLTVVGDDDQSIYGFRGARPQVMLNFVKDYPNAKQVYLSTNYRSCKYIIQSANNLIKWNNERFAKDFLGFKEETGSVEMIVGTDRTQEILKTRLKIQELLKNEVKPEDIAILYRTNAQSESIADSLLSAKIPFHSKDKIPNRYEHWMFDDILAFYNLANNKSKNVKKDLSQVLNHPNRFLFDRRYIQAGLNKNEMERVAFKIGGKSWQIDKRLDEIRNFFWQLEVLKNMEPSRFLDILNRKYCIYLKEYADYRNVDYAELLEIWQKYKEDAKNHDSWKEWGTYIYRYKLAMKQAQNNEGITLSTMHSSKGLEWNHVFIIDCVNEICPFEKKGSSCDYEEERRLFYVGMTRAKEHLYLCTYQNKNGKRVNPSPYLKNASI